MTVVEPEQTALPNLLPDLPDYVHGIVQIEPYIRIQCDGCGHIHDGRPGKAGIAIILSGIQFSPRRAHHPTNPDRRRLCVDCRKVEWGDE